MILTGIGIVGSQCTSVSYTCIVQCYTANTTWYCWPGAACAEVITIGAGGAGAAGGSTPTPGPNKASTGGAGGGGGGVSICTVSADTFGKCQTLVVGSGNSCFGALVTATKGSDGCAAISNTTAFPEISTGTTPGGIGNYACGGGGGASCTAAGEVSAFGGGSCATAPGGGGGGGSVYVTNTGTYYASFGGDGGSGQTLCGITLGAGGRGGAGLSCIPPGSNTGRTTCPGASYGGGGGGGAAGSRTGAQAGQAGGPGIIKITQFVIPVTPVLDTYSSALEAYSLRLLRTEYAGNAIRVRRSSDNAEQNIGFVNGYLDTASLLTFVGAGNGFITTWYDQSGNSRNITQTTAGNQPRIVTSGALLLSNGKTTVSFGTASDDWWLNMNGLGGVSTISLFATWTITDGPTNGGVYGPSTTNVGIGLEIIQAGPTNQTLVRINGTQRITGSTTASRLWTSATQTISTILGNSTSITALKNNASVTMANSTAMPTLNSSEPTSLGRYYDPVSYNMNGNIQEWIIWTSNQTSNSSAINSNINSYYGAY
jgi:hypothetical protein